jgi:hypothetical protein
MTKSPWGSFDKGAKVQVLRNALCFTDLRSSTSAKSPMHPRNTAGGILVFGVLGGDVLFGSNPFFIQIRINERSFPH